MIQRLKIMEVWLELRRWEISSHHLQALLLAVMELEVVVEVVVVEMK